MNVMTAKKKEIPIPSDPLELIYLGVKVYARHCVMGNKSPLLALQSNSWEESGSDVNNALRLHEFAEENICFSKEYLCKRDELIINIKASIQASHDLLYEIYSDNPSELGFWGFDLE
jgi:hypothetical protein